MHPASITAAQRMRAADIAADAALQDASTSSVSIALQLQILPQLHDADAIVLVHALRCAIERSGHGHIERWADLAEELTGWVRLFDEAAEAEAA